MNGSIESFDGVADRWLRVALAVEGAGSFTAAAEYVGVGQSSVSHAMKQLERALGFAVFDRTDRGVEPTAAGTVLLGQIRPHFDGVDLAIRDSRRSALDAQLVTVSVSTSFAAWWLLPRLAEFKTEHPDLELRCVTSDNDDRVGHDDADVWIPHGRARWDHLVSRHLTDERIIAVAAPRIAARLEQPENPVSLLDADLIHLEERYFSRFDWYRWFVAKNIAPPPLRGPRLNDYSVVVQAALDGQGFILGWDHIVAPLVAAGRLVEVGGAPIVTDQDFVVLQRPGQQPEAVTALCDWLVRRTP